jgi:hypothetical protein
MLEEKNSANVDELLAQAQKPAGGPGLVGITHNKS